MKIAFDHQIFTSQVYGGISRYFTILAIELIKLEQSIDIYAGIYKNDYLSRLPQHIVHGVRLNIYPPHSTRFFQLLNHFHTNFCAINNRPDILHETYFSSRSLRTKNTPIIVTIYDMIHEIYKESFPRYDNTSKNKKISLNRADHIISISHNTKQDLIDRFEIEPAKISVVHLGVETDIFRNTFNVQNSFSKKPYLLYVGKRAGYKNFKKLIKAFSLSEELKKDFSIICFGGGLLGKDEIDYILSLGLTESHVIHLSGTDQLLATLYQNAEAYVCTSQYEGFGLPPLEAMAANCPVISSGSSSLPEVINKAGQYFNAQSSSDLLYAIQSVIFSPSRRKELIDLGKENVKLFSWKNCAIQTLNIYNQFI